MHNIKDLIKKIREAKSGKTVLSSKTVQAGTRKLRAEWTAEMAYELLQYTEIDAEKELETLLIKEINNLNNDRNLL